MAPSAPSSSSTSATAFTTTTTHAHAYAQRHEAHPYSRPSPSAQPQSFAGPIPQNQNQNANYAAYPASTHNERARTRSAPSTSAPKATSASGSGSVSTGTHPSTSTLSFVSAKSGTSIPIPVPEPVNFDPNFDVNARADHEDRAIYGSPSGSGVVSERVRAISTERKAAKWRPPTPAGGAPPPGASSGMVRTTPFSNPFSNPFSGSTATSTSNGRPAHLATPPGLGSSLGQHQNHLQQQPPPVSSSSSLAAAAVNANANTTTTSTGTPPTRRPSLASPLPPTPLVPSTPLTKRFAGGVPAPLNLAGSSASSSPASGVSGAAAAANSSAAKSRLGNHNHTRHTSGSISSPPVSPHPSPPNAPSNTRPQTPLTHAQSQWAHAHARPSTATGAGAGTGGQALALPESPSTTAMMKRLLAKPAPVMCPGTSAPTNSSGLGFTSGSESEGWTSAASGPAAAAVGYTKRRKEAFSSRRERKTAEEREREMARGTADIQFEMGAGALDLELELGRGLGISGAGYGRGGEAWMEHGSPASSSAHSNHPYGQFSPSVSVSSPLSGGTKENSKEKRRPNVLKRRPSTAAAAVQPASTPALTLPPQPLFSPLSLSPVHPHPNLNIPSCASSSSSTFARGAISGHHDELGPSASASRSASSFDAHPNSNSSHSHHHHTHGDLSQHRQQHIVPQQNSSKHYRPPLSPQGLAALSQSQMQRSTSASASLGSSPHAHSPALTTTSTKAVKILQSLNPTRAEMHMAHTHTHTPPSPHASLRPHQHLPGSSRRSSHSRSRAGSPPRSPIASTLVPGSVAGSGTVTGTATPTPNPGLNPTLLGPSQSMSMLSALAPAGERGREGGRSEKMKDKGREKEREKERSKATPASSLIEAYKRQEREREELERVARMGEVLDDHVDLDADLEEVPVHVRPRSMDKARRLLGDEVDFTGSWRAASQQPSMNHNQGQSRSQPSSFGRSKGRRHSIATSISLLDAYPSLNKDEPSQTTSNSSAAARRNLNIDTSTPSFIKRRKAIHSFASMDSGLDLAPRLASDVEEPHRELGTDRLNGFGVIERLVVAHPPSPSPSPSPNPPSTRPHQHQSHSQPSTQPHTPEPATPYYTVFGSTSGRVVAVGGREDAAWDAYGLGYWDSGMGGLGRRTTVGAGASGGKEKEKEKPSLGRSLSRKVSGRWRKHGGVVVGVISDSEKDRSKERGRDRILPHVPGRSSMQERRKAGSTSRREDVEREEDEEKQKIRNRRSLRLSIEKFADLDVGVEEDGRFRRLGAGASPERDVNLNSEDEEEVDDSKEVELPVPRHVYLKEEPGSSSTVSSPAGGGGRFWKLMKRISVGGGLRDKFLGPSSSAGGTPTDAHPPPVPPLPPNLASLASTTPPHNQIQHQHPSQKTEAEAKPKHRLHGSRSTDSSLKFLRNRGATASSKSSSTASSPTPHTDLNSYSKDSSMPLASPNTRKAPPASTATALAAVSTSGTTNSSPNLASTSTSTPNHPRRSTTTRSSSPVSSSDVASASASASTKLFHHAQSSRSSESSFSEEKEAVPPLPQAKMLAQHIIAPSELRRVGEADDLSHSRVQHRHQQGAIGMGLGLGMAGMTVRMPSPRDLSEEDWMIVRSPSVELPSLTLPPRRARAAAAPLSTSSNSNAPAASSPLASSSPPSALGGGSPPSLPFCPVRAGEFSVDFDFDRDLEGTGMDRSESPTIPSFSTAGAVNAFPSRRLSSISKSSKARSSPSTPHPPSAGGIGPVSPSPAALSASTSATSPTSATPTSSLKHSLSLPTPTSLPPPPRPLRSAHRPGPGVSPAGAQGTLRSASASASLPASSTRGGDAPAPSTSFLPRLQGEGADAGRAQILLPQVEINPGADGIPPGRRSESHATSSSSNAVKSLAGFNQQHNRRSSGGTSVLTLRPSAGQRRSSSFGAPSVSLSSLAPDSPLEREDSADMWSERGKEKDKDVKKFALTEQEKAAKWADLLERSERAGGTLHIELGMRLGR